MSTDSLPLLLLIVGIVVVVGITIEVWIRRADRKRPLDTVVRIDGIKVPARVDRRTGEVSTNAPFRPGQSIEVSYTYTKKKDPVSDREV